MTKPTPGPWKAEDGYYVLSSDGRNICDTTHRSSTIDVEVSMANTKLIADAPRLKESNAELLKACEDLLETCLVAEEMDSLPDVVSDTVLEYARAAIAKARGEA